MKKLNRLPVIVLALALILSLAACKNKNSGDATDAKGQTITADTSDSIGSVMLIGENYLTVYYDDDGEVVSTVDSEGNGVYKDLNGKACAKAVAELLKKSDPPVVTTSLLIKHVRGSQLPNDNFLQGITTEAKLAIGDKPVVVSAADDQNDMGYFSAETAKAVLAAYLGNPENAEYVTATKPVDGYYDVRVTVEGRTDDYSVGAYYGHVELIFDDGEPDLDVEMPDYFVDDGTNMDITDNPELEQTA